MLINEIDRRGFLRGVAGAGIAAAGVGAQAKSAPPETTGVSMNTGPEHAVQRAALKSGIRGTELAQFMAQTRHESADFTRMKEIGGAKYFAQRYDPKYAPGKAKILGNKHHGDGALYQGLSKLQAETTIEWPEPH